MTQVHPDKRRPALVMLAPASKGPNPHAEPSRTEASHKPISTELADARAAALASGWPIPAEGPWCLRYNQTVRQRPGFYDPPDLYSSPARTARIHAEYPEIHAWADAIANAWYGKSFRQIPSPAKRNRIVAAMLFEAHGQGNARIAGIEPYLQLLRAHATELAVGWIVAISRALAQALAVLAGGGLLRQNRQLAAGAAVMLDDVADLTEKLGHIAMLVEAGQIGDIEAAGEIAASVLDVLDDLTELAPGSLDKKLLASIGERIRQGLDAATALAAAIHDAD